MKKFRTKLISFLFVPAFLLAQTPVPPTGAPSALPAGNTPASNGGAQPIEQGATTSPAEAAVNVRPVAASPNYVLGPDDTITITALEADEISNKPIHIGGDGFVNLPMVGRVHAGGLTIQQFEAELVKRLGEFMTNPQVTVMVSDYRSQPVAVVGEVGAPGTVQLRGRRNLVEVVSMVGGLRPTAGARAIVTRRTNRGTLSLPGAQTDASGQYSTATVQLRDVMDGLKPAENIQIQPDDVITVPKAHMIYIMGEVGRPGGYVSDHDQETISILQALALAGGLKPTARPSKARILRPESGKTDRAEMATDVRKIMQGDSPDVTLHPDDILFIPNNVPKSVGLRTLESAVNIGTGMAIWRF